MTKLLGNHIELTSYGGKKHALWACSISRFLYMMKNKLIKKFLVNVPT